MRVYVTTLSTVMSVGWPGAGAKQTGWTPTSVAEASPHTGCHIVLVCAERILLDWRGTGVVSNCPSVWPALASPATWSGSSPTAAPPPVSTADWWWSAAEKFRKSPKNEKKKKKKSSLSGHIYSKAAQQKVTRWMSEWMLQCSSANIITQMSPEQAAANLITFLPQWLSNFWLQVGTICLFLNETKYKPR